MKKALITGITGQDGSYLAEFLLEKGYEVHGMIRRSSLINTHRIDHLYKDPHYNDVRLFLHYGDLTDSTNIIRLIQQIQPDEIYNLAAMSHVKVSFDTPEYTGNADGLGTLRFLDAIRLLGIVRKSCRNSSKGNDTVLSAFTVRSCKTLRILDYKKLQRSLRYFWL